MRSSSVSITSFPSMKALIHIPGISLISRSSQQSFSRITRSWDTSTRRLVRYPESAVRSAVSDRPLRAPWAEIKYSSTSNPSRKLDLIGNSIVRPDVSAISPRIPASCLICLSEPRAPESAIINILLYLSRPVRRAWVISSSASFQVSTTDLYLSSSVSRPRRYFCEITSTVSSAPLMISFFAAGTSISEMDTVIAARVENL